MSGIISAGTMGGLIWFRGQLLTAVVLGAMAGLLGAPAAWAQAPQVASVDPADGATDVPRITGMVFVFDQPMDTSVDLEPNFPPFLVGNYELSFDLTTVIYRWDWSEDGRTLTGTLLVGEFPSGTLVTWKLNPSGGGEEPLVSESGVPLAETVGTFTTAGQSTGGGGDEDCDGFPDTWGSYSVFKGASYEQTSAADPVSAAEAPFMFGAAVRAPEAGPELTEGSVTIPEIGEQELDAAPFTGDLYLFGTFPSESIWESVIPAGTYTIRFTQAGQGERVISMDLPASNIPIPKIANFAEAQSIDETQDFTLRWNELTGAGADGYLSITVEDDTFGFDTVFQAPNYCVPLELPASATSVVIPANTLSPDRIYQGTLTFGHYGYLSTNDIPEMAGSAGVLKITNFTLNTGTGGTEPAMPATLGIIQFLPNGDPQLSLSGTAGRAYRVERTGSLDAPAWVELGAATMDAGGKGVFVDTIAQNVHPLFYRAVAD